MALAINRARRKTYFVLATLAFGFAFGVAMMLPGVLGALAAPAAMAFALGGFICSLGYFSNMDELSQRAHYIAWFWGGTAGLGVLSIGVFYLAYGGQDWGEVLAPLLERYWGRADMPGGFSAGITLVLGVQLIGSLLWWAGYWLRKR